LRGMGAPIVWEANSLVVYAILVALTDNDRC
jgi:hypothetical protein